MREQGVGIPVRAARAVPRAVDELLRPAVHRRMLRNIGRLNNRAVFEVPEILHRILSERWGATGLSRLHQNTPAARRFIGI